MKKTVPLYWGYPDDPNRRLVGHAVVDEDTGKFDGYISHEEISAAEAVSESTRLGETSILVEGLSIRFRGNVADGLPPHTVLSPGALRVKDDAEIKLDQQIEALHGPGAVEALDAAIADGSIFSESSRDDHE